MISEAVSFWQSLTILLLVNHHLKCGNCLTTRFFQNVYWSKNLLKPHSRDSNKSNFQPIKHSLSELVAKLQQEISHRSEKSRIYIHRSPYIIDGADFYKHDPFGNMPDCPIPRNESSIFYKPNVTEDEEDTVSSEPRKISGNWHRIHRNSYQIMPFSDGNVEWDNYDPKLIYFTDSYDNEKYNPYYNGSIPSNKPSYLQPGLKYDRTGRKRDNHRRTDTGIKQRIRWGGPSPWTEDYKDITRGNWTRENDTFTDMLASVDWERRFPHMHDQNYFKRSIIETGWGHDNQIQDSYWDIQFIGTPDTFPRTESAGMNFTLDINWIPFLKKKHPKGNQPIKSKPFCLGGVDPVQVWFWPDGSSLSGKDFSSIKLVTRPGWNLPFNITLWASSEYGKVSHGPFLINTAQYTSSSINFCRFLPKGNLSQRDRSGNSLILGPSGNVKIGVGIADQDWEWDDGTWDFENWLKKQTAIPDNDLTRKLPTSFTHSEWYENFKYKDIPDKHFSKYLPNNLSKDPNIWNRHAF